MEQALWSMFSLALVVFVGIGAIMALWWKAARWIIVGGIAGMLFFAPPIWAVFGRSAIITLVLLFIGTFVALRWSPLRARLELWNTLVGAELGSERLDDVPSELVDVMTSILQIQYDLRLSMLRSPRAARPALDPVLDAVNHAVMEARAIARASAPLFEQLDRMSQEAVDEHIAAAQRNHDAAPTAELRQVYADTLAAWQQTQTQRRTMCTRAQQASAELARLHATLETILNDTVAVSNVEPRAAATPVHAAQQRLADIQINLQALRSVLLQDAAIPLQDVRIR